MLRRNTNTIVITPQKKELDEIRLQVNSEKNNIQVLSQEIIKLENKKSDLSKEVQKLLDSFLFSQSKIAESEDILKKNEAIVMHNFYSQWFEDTRYLFDTEIQAKNAIKELKNWKVEL